MKRHIIYLTAILLFSGIAQNADAMPVFELGFGKGFVKIVNDTKQDVHIYTGTGHVKLIHGGGSTSVSCEEGKEICFSNKGKRGRVIFSIKSSMCGKTIKLSAYLK